jgi:GR25 family glycosyltransferase involved in LPS biosynthesis
MTPIFIVHYYKLSNRREYLQERLPSAHFVTRYSPEYLVDKQLSSYKPDEDKWTLKCSNMYGDIPEFKQMSTGMISCTIAHREILRWVADNLESAIILEDDAILGAGVTHKVISDAVETAPDHDVLFLGGAFQHTVAPSKGLIIRPWILKGHPASNTVCAYAVTNMAARKIVDGLEEFTLPIDFELNHIMQKEDMRVWHHIPYLIREGSSLGIYNSSQERK